MISNVEIQKAGNENTANLIRRFSKHIRSSGIIPKVKSSRYFDRSLSRYNKKQRALKRIERREKVEELLKLGLTPPTKKRGRRRH